MATIQIRDVPDDVHAVYRTRAAAAGMSLQEYIRREMEEAAKVNSPAEIVDEVARERRVRGDSGYSQVSGADLIRDERETR